MQPAASWKDSVNEVCSANREHIDLVKKSLERDELLEVLGKELRELANDPNASAVHILAVTGAQASCKEISLSQIFMPIE